MTDLAVDSGGKPIQAIKPGATQVVAYTDAAAVTAAAVGADARLVRVWATTDCHIEIAAAPVAVVTDMPLSAGVAEYFKVSPGVDKISAIRQANGASGNLFVTDCK